MNDFSRDSFALSANALPPAAIFMKIVLPANTNIVNRLMLYVYAVIGLVFLGMTIHKMSMIMKARTSLKMASVLRFVRQKE